MNCQLLIRSLLVAAIIACSTSTATACSSFRIVTKDGHVFFVFNFELGGDADSKVTFFPAGTPFTGSAPEGRKPAGWKSKYAVVGVDWFNTKVVGGGINEHGLAGANLNLPGFTKYQAVTEKDDNNIIAAWEVPTYILTQFKNVAEVKEGLKKVKVANRFWEQAKATIEFHYTFHDTSRASIVVEYIGGELKIFDNKLGVMTNSPDFEWQRVNLRNYINLSAIDPQPKKVADVDLLSTGVGSGLLGLPGDYTPPSRFVRATVLSQTVLPSANHEEGLQMAMRVSSAMSFPAGPSRQQMGDKAYPGMTQWVMLADLSKRKMYFRHYDYQNWRFTNLESLMKQNDGVVYFDLTKGKPIEDVSDQLKADPKRSR